ncbi:efflux RND transporter permease subunit [Malaciobacter mytili]|uniref:efflux RND transporter permease subunit n=1 Tax=Malaciobacter mytili TaxID=603050 RepID=UPI003A8AC403
MIDKTRFAQNIIKYRWKIVIILPLLIILLFTLNLKKAGVETDFKIWFDEDSQVMQNFEHFKETFGSNDRLMIALRSEEGIFKKDILKNIQKITEELWQTKFVARVDSITNFQYVHTNKEDKDEIIVENFLTNIDALSNEELKQKEQIAKNDIQIKNLLISEDGKSAVIVASMVYSKYLKSNDYITFYNSINQIIEKNKLKSVEYHNIGVPAYTNAFMEAINSNAKIFFPIILLTIISLLLIIFRNIWSILLPLTVVILTILFVAGFTFGLGYKLNTITSMFPIFIIAIAIADSIHIFWVWKYKREEGFSNNESIICSIEKNFMPALITSLTTFIGFISLGISKIIPLQAFGILLASAALMAFILSIIFLPAILSIVNPKVKPKEQKMINLKIFISKYTKFIVKNDKAIVISSLVFIIFCIVGIKDISIDTEFAKQFSKDSQIRKSSDFVEKNIGGTISIEIIIDSKEKLGITNPKLMQAVEDFNKAFMHKFKKIRHINSLTQIVKKYHKLMNAGKDEFYKIPDSKELISQYMLLYSLSLPRGMGINDMMDVENRFLRVTAMMNIVSETEKMQIYDWTKNWWKQNSEFTATIEGITMISGHMKVQLTDTIIKSIFLSLIFVTIIFWVTFKSKFFMLISTLPNIAPLLISIGLTGWLNINLDLGMAIVFVIIIGIAIDDTVHFLSKYKVAIQKTKSLSESIEETLLFSGIAIIITTIVLVLGFGTFLFSNFTVYSNFGLLSSISLSLAMIFDLMLLPAIISLVEKNRIK